MKQLLAKVGRYYLPLLHTILMTLLLGVSMAVLFNAPGDFVGWIALVCTAAFGLLTLDSVRLTRKVIFKHRSYNRQYGKSLSRSVQTIFKKERGHPLLDNHLTLYYEVPVLTGSTEYVERLSFYKWLNRVWQFQHSPYRTAQQSPLAQRRWEGELGGTNRYLAYMYILETCDAIDPESSYHVKKLRLSPWNVIIIADDRLPVRSL